MKFFASAFSGTRARWFRLTVAPIFLISLLGLSLFGAGCSDDAGDVTYPDPPPPVERNWLFDVYGTSASDVYACGNRGAMFHYDGTEWSFVEMGSGSPITKIWGPEGGPLYSVGHGGNLWQLVGTSWSPLSSGTTKNLYSIGTFNSEIHLCGVDGTLRRLNGSSWTDVGQIMVQRSPAIPHAVEDTLILSEDVFSLVTMNQYFVGGAYKLDTYDDQVGGLIGTDGMVMTTDSEPDLYDWLLRPIGDDQFADSEWVMCTTNSVATLADNYLGTSEGWLFQLTLSDEGTNVWSKMAPDLTETSKTGIRDIWLDEDRNLYMVTDEGKLIFQTQDYNFTEGLGMRKFFQVSHNSLTGIWGADTDNLFMTGFTEDIIYEASMDFSDTSLVFTAVPLEFPNKGGQSIGMFEDQFGMPRF